MALTWQSHQFHHHCDSWAVFSWIVSPAWSVCRSLLACVESSSSRSKTKWWRSCASSKTPKSSSKTQSGSKFQAGAGTKTRLCLACRNSCSRFKTSWESSSSRCSRKSWLVRRMTSKRFSAGCRAQANERKPPASLSQGCDLRAGITKQEIRGLD